jgi:hypothetical protein
MIHCGRGLAKLKRAGSRVIAWRKDMQQRSLSPGSSHRNLSALPSLFDYLCERNVITSPFDGVKR